MSDAAESSRTDWIALWPQLTGLTGGAAILISVTYNWAYFETLYPPALGLMSIGDHVASAIAWFPVAVLPIFLGQFLGGYLREQFRTPQNPVQAATAARTAAQDRIIKRIVGITFLVCAIASRLFFPAGDYGATTILLLLALQSWTWRRTGFLDYNLRTALNYMLFLVAVALMFGNQHGIRDLEKTTADSKLWTKDAKAPIDVEVLRLLDQGPLVRLPEKRNIMLFRWDQITGLETRDNYDPRRQSCVWFGWLCP